LNGISKMRISELDGLRGGAALSVVLFHYIFHYDSIYGHDFVPLDFIHYGKYGVNLFFIISGFVICWTLSKTVRPLDFIWSRFSRLYPVYWCCLIITFITVLFFGLPGREVSLIDFILNFSMLQQHIGFKHVDGVYWTLTLELSFYFWMLLLFTFKQMDNLEYYFIFWVVIAKLLILSESYVGPIWQIKRLFIVEYIEFFAVGICYYKINNKIHTVKTYLLFIICTLVVFFFYEISTALIFLSFYLIFYLLITGNLKFLAVKPLIFLGSISYSLYLLHQNIGYIIINTFYKNDWSSWLGILLSIIFSILLATLLTKFIETPSLKYLRSFYKNNIRTKW